MTRVEVDGANPGITREDEKASRTPRSRSFSTPCSDCVIRIRRNESSVNIVRLDLRVRTYVSRGRQKIFFFVMSPDILWGRDQPCGRTG